MAHPPSVPNRDGGSRWLLACGVGCGALLLIAVLGIIAGFSALQYGLGQAATGIRVEMDKEYTRLQEEEKIPAEHAEVVDRIYTAAGNDEASFWTTIMGFVVITSYVDDGEVSESEAESMAALADFLEANPDAGMMELGRFVEEHPEFESAFQDAQRTFEKMGDGPDSEDVDLPDVEDPESL